MKPTTAKADQTLIRIVRTAFDIAMTDGIADVSFGKVAKHLRMSKSGVFSRVGSLHSLQEAVLDEYDRRFVDEIVTPAKRAPRGLPMLEIVIRNMTSRSSGNADAIPCLYMAATLSGADLVLQARLERGLARWRTLLRQGVCDAVQSGQLAVDTDHEQLVFEINSLVVGMAQNARLQRDSGLGGRMMDAYHRVLGFYTQALAHAG